MFRNVSIAHATDAVSINGELIFETYCTACTHALGSELGAMIDEFQIDLSLTNSTYSYIPLFRGDSKNYSILIIAPLHGNL